jgi:hypothetical protein
MRKVWLIIRSSVFLVMAISSLQAEMAPLYWSSLGLFDRVVTQARDNPELKDAAFHFLRVVAEGRKDEISRESLAAFSYRGDYFQPRELAEIGVRARAYEQIGRLATPEALAYLESIDLAQFTTVEDQPFAMSIPFGIFLAKAGQIEDPQRRWEFYAETLRHPPEGLGRGGPLAAAYGGLCTEGALGFLPNVEAHIRRGSARKDQEEQIQSCKQMMHLVASHSSRAAGLEAALYVDTNVYGKYFRSWAIQELGEMHTEESQAILKKFVQTEPAKLGPSDETRREAIRQDPMLWSDFQSARLALRLSAKNKERDGNE